MFRFIRPLVACALTALFCHAPSAYAWDGAKTGKITAIDIAEGQNFGFRIYMDGNPMCGTTDAFAYMNRDWDNYDAMAALLTSAYFSGKSVLVYTTKVGTNCKIGYVTVRG